MERQQARTARRLTVLDLGLICWVKIHWTEHLWLVVTSVEINYALRNGRERCQNCKDSAIVTKNDFVSFGEQQAICWRVSPDQIVRSYYQGLA